MPDKETILVILALLAIWFFFLRAKPASAAQISAARAGGTSLPGTALTGTASAGLTAGQAFGMLTSAATFGGNQQYTLQPEDTGTPAFGSAAPSDPSAPML